jgi:hypothetical protein
LLPQIKKKKLKEKGRNEERKKATGTEIDT